MIARNVREALQINGIKGLIRFLLQKAVNMEDVDNQLYTAHYIINQYCDIQAFPKAEGNLRNLQKGDLILLEIFDTICRKRNLKYWLDSGTLLGAVRHSGFIPWDDDLDVCMPRDDYETARIILTEELSKYGIDVNESRCRLGIGYNHKSTGIWLDVFPMDYISLDITDGCIKQDFLQKCYRYRRIWKKKEKKLDREHTFSLRKKILPEICNMTDAKAILWFVELNEIQNVWALSDIFPLKEHVFEGKLFYIPCNTDKYLKDLYGNYMGFPRKGIEAHGDERGSLSNWASNSGIDMNVTLDELNKILDSVKNN